MRAGSLLSDIAAASGTLLTVPLAGCDPRTAAFARATPVFPLFGLIVGAGILVLERGLLYHLPPAIAAVLFVLAWEAMTRVAAVRIALQEPRHIDLQRVLLLLVSTVKVAGLAFAPAARVPAALFAPLLGRWSLVVLATGTRDATRTGRKFNGAITFREFALASICTFAICFTIAEFVGVFLVVGAAALTLLLRVTLHHWNGGLTWTWLLLGCESVEALVVLLLAIAVPGPSSR
jgi:cobalamin synthase